MATTTPTLTERVERSFETSRSDRFQEVMQALVRHLHGFASEIHLTEQEWFLAIDFLTRTGHITDERRQEFILLSDVLGLSMLTVGLNQTTGTEATEATVFGPFFSEGSPEVPQGGDLARGFAGERMLVTGQILSTSGGPVPDARLEVWHSDAEGNYDVQYEDLDQPRGRGHLLTDPDGCFSFWTVRPAAYPIPSDGPVGELLAAAQRSPMRPAHVHFMVSAPGHRKLITHVFDREDSHLESDAVFGVKASLVADFARHEPGVAPDGKAQDVPYSTLAFDLVIAPNEGANA